MWETFFDYCMTDVLIIFGLFLLNGLFAMSEIALVSSRKSRLNHLATEGSNGAKIAIALLKEPEKFLSTIQIGITLVGIIAGAYGGEAFTHRVQPFFENIVFLKPYAEEIAFTTIVITITFFSLIIGELVPKSIALSNPEKITIALAPFMKGLAIFTYPFVVFLSFSTKLFLKIFMIKGSKEPPVTEEELKYLIDTGSSHGIIEKQESEIMHGVFRFGDKKAEDIMTRKKDIIWLNINQTLAELKDHVFKAKSTKFPVCEDTLDKIVGVIYIKDVLKYFENNYDEFVLKDHIKDPVFFPSTTPALRILEAFRNKQIHIAFVVDEYGGIVGLITLHDLVENIIGDLPEDDDEDLLKVVSREDGSILIDGDIKIDELKKILNIHAFPEEKTYLTLAGLMISQLHVIPKAGDSFILENFKFEVVDMDGHRIDKVLVTPQSYN